MGDYRQFFSTHLTAIRWGSKGEGSAKCPFHDDHRSSLSVNWNNGLWFCHACNIGGTISQFAERFGLEAPEGSSQSAEYSFDYRDEKGRVLFQVVRLPGKKFLQRRPNGKGGWEWNLKGVRRVPYRLPELLTSTDSVLIVEGEKDVESLRAKRFTATCNAGGAGKWRTDFSEHLRGRVCILIADNDTPGRRHVQDVAQKLTGYAAKIIHLGFLPGVDEHGDVSDWFAAGHTREELVALIESAEQQCGNGDTAQPTADSFGSNMLPDGKRGLPELYSQSRLADEFERRHCDELRYVEPGKDWLHFNGKIWVRGAGGLALDLAENIVREASQNALVKGANCGTARTLASYNHYSSVEKTARFRKSFRSAPDDWDREPFLLGTPDGVIDISDGGRHLVPRRDYMITRCTRVVPANSSEGAIQWRLALHHIYRDNPEMIELIQELGGYCLTGDVREDLIPVAWGPGGNGKTVVFKTLTEVAGSYAHVMSCETLMETYGDRHPEELVRLQKIRLAVASEIPEGRRWNDARLKLLTGREKIAARDMYAKTFVFDPSHKLIIYGNHLPGFRAVTEAIRGRIRILPHQVIIRGTTTEIKGLDELLKVEYPAILRWFIDGAVRWVRRGRLIIPQCVIDTTRNYLDSEDELGGFLEACAEPWPDDAVDAPRNNEGMLQNRVKLAEVVRAFNDWRESNAGGSRIKALDSTRLGTKLRDRGFQVDHFRDGSYVWRLRLKRTRFATD